MKTLLLLPALFSLPALLLGQSYQPDPSYGQNGFGTHNWGTGLVNNLYLHNATLDAQNRIVFSGMKSEGIPNKSLAFSCFTATGVTDLSFGLANGEIQYEDFIYIGSAYRPLITRETNSYQTLCDYIDPSGNSTTFAFQVDENGLPDYSFGNQGTLNLSNINPVWITNDIDNYSLVGGTYYSLEDIDFTRLLPGGTYDSDFGFNGFTQVSDPGETHSIRGMYRAGGNKILSLLLTEIQDSTDEILTLGVVRLNEDGSPDLTFGTDAVSFPYDQFEDLNVWNSTQDSEGRILLCGRIEMDWEYYNFLGRLTPEGLPDQTFGESGFIIHQLGAAYELGFQDVVENLDGQIFTITTTPNEEEVHLLEFNPDGSLVNNPESVILPAGPETDDRTFNGRFLEVDDQNRLYVVGNSLYTPDVSSDVFSYRLTQNPVSTKDLSEDQGFKIHPNPTNGAISIRLSANEASEIQCTLIAMDGRLIQDLGSLSAKAGENKLDVNLPTNIPNGMYVLQMQGEKRVISKPLVIQR
ncbi:MAG: T9SS type A sorting domain-containing protein [Bacteroidetes bacterium]|nr:T9SS type A sorting domain-containing protein [Bacteroidota bacterium]